MAELTIRSLLKMMRADCLSFRAISFSYRLAKFSTQTSLLCRSVCTKTSGKYFTVQTEKTRLISNQYIYIYIYIYIYTYIYNIHVYNIHVYNTHVYNTHEYNTHV